jgi:WD40 repeat protein/serine/threonine protein kinase
MAEGRLSIREIFDEAWELPPGERRQAYLDRACGGDAVLRANIEELLRSEAAAGDFLADRLRSATIAITPATEREGDRIGHYKLLEKLGEGGCGTVYVAEQSEPVRRRVALKVIKLGMDTKQVIARFEAERQALAMMDHPNIAKVLDGGATENGRPYFVMELVRGIKITEYCDQATLTTAERLDLFIKVCQAIQHAHQKGIIHRDIKPSNILVTLHDGAPVPKVIDFGIAKASEGRLTDATIYTQLHQFIGTPAYMSPEQAEMTGLDIDTRSDIYSLGVLLYELLAGNTPFDAKELMAQGIDTMRKTIREQEPPRPSTRFATLEDKESTTTAKRRSVEKSKLVHQLKGDLDWIVMKCLEKDRTRRYDTANGLALDLTRHLNNEAVLARPPSRLYEFQKMVRRHKFGFASAIALILALAIGALTSTWQAIKARRAQQEAVRERIVAQDARADAVAQQQKAEAERKKAQEQLVRAEWMLYSSKLILAQTDFEAGNGELALRYLGECQENLRGWEYRYLWTRINGKQTLVGHTGTVSSVAFSPDGQRILTGSEDGTAKVWDAVTGREVLALEEPKGLVLSVAFSQDGQRILTAGGERGSGKRTGGAQVWDAATGQELLDLKGHSYCVWSAAFSPDGKRIVTGAGDWAYGPGEAKVWDAETGQELLALRGHSNSVRSVAFSPDSKRILTGSVDRTARVWDAISGKEVLTLNGHGDAVRGVAFSPDGRRIVTASTDTTSRVWDANTGQVVFALALNGLAEQLNSVAFSPDGKRIVTGTWDGTVKVWDADAGREVLTLKGHASSVRGVAFSPDGRRIVSGSQDKTAKVWDAATGQEVPTLKGHIDFVSSIAFSPDGKRIVTGSGDGAARVWNTTTSQEVLTLGSPARPWTEAGAGVWGVAFSPDGKRIVTGSQDKTAKMWDAATGQELLILQHPNVVWSVAFSPDGQRIVTGSSDQTAKVWDIATGQEHLILKGHAGDVRSVAFSPDGQHIATGSLDQTARVWDATTAQQLLVLHHTDRVSSVAFSPDGKHIVTGSQDKTAKVWDAATGQELLTLKGHTSYVRSVAFSPDGTRIVTGSDDRTARLWNAVTGQEAFSFKDTTGVWSVAFSPDGTRIVTGIAGLNATAKVWYAPTTLQ